MFGPTYSYNKTIKKYNDIIGALFSNIKLSRTNTAGTKTTFQKVPTEFAPHTKYIDRTEKDPDIERTVAIQLPRISYELLDLKYDPARQLNPITRMVHYENGDPSIRYVPVPYMYTYQVYVYTKFLEDQYQIAEQILPYFSPKISLSAELVDGSGCATGVDILLDAIDMKDSFEGALMGPQRQIIWTYIFTVPGWIMSPDMTSEFSGRVIRWVRTSTGVDDKYREVSNTYPILAGTALEDIEPTDPYVLQTDHTTETSE